MWMTSWPEAWAEIWEKSVDWVLASEEDGWLSELLEALRRVSHVVGTDGKVSIERMRIFLLMSKNHLTQGNKKFCTWTKKS